MAHTTALIFITIYVINTYIFNLKNIYPLTFAFLSRTTKCSLQIYLQLIKNSSILDVIAGSEVFVTVVTSYLRGWGGTLEKCFHIYPSRLNSDMFYLGAHSQSRILQCITNLKCQESSISQSSLYISILISESNLPPDSTNCECVTFTSMFTIETQYDRLYFKA